MKMRLRDTIGFPADVIVSGELNQLPRRRCSPSNRRLAADNRPPPLPSPSKAICSRYFVLPLFYFFSRKSSPRCSAIFLFRVILRCINVHHSRSIRVVIFDIFLLILKLRDFGQYFFFFLITISSDIRILSRILTKILPFFLFSSPRESHSILVPLCIYIYIYKTGEPIKQE